jgi:hypothetical protein
VSLDAELPQRLSRPAEGRNIFLSLAILGLTVIAWLKAPSLIQHTEGTFSDDLFYLRAVVKLSVLIVGSLLSTFVLVPSLAACLESLSRHWKSFYTYLSLAAACLFQWAFVVYAGRRQFGAFDYNILMQIGWREVLGQRPYVDFLTTTPPVFNLGILYAYRIFSVSWDANLYLTAFFTCATFLWIYWLFRRLSLNRVAALFIASAIECAAMLTLSFWWYNNTTTILAAILFLSTLVYASDPVAPSAQASYVVSLALTALTKPNIAGVTILGCLAMLLVVCDRRGRTMLLTLSAGVFATVFLLLNHVSIPAMLRSYRGVAGERGFGVFGFGHMNDFEQYTSLCWLVLLCLPLCALLRRTRFQLQHGDWKAAASTLFFLLAPAVAIYGVATNGEFYQVECTLLLAAGAVIAFGKKLNPPIVVRIYIAFLVAFTIGSLYSGVARLRVYEVGKHMFFEWQDNRNRIASGALTNMQVSGTMIDVERQVEAVMKDNPGPYYFGPRLDFNYAVYRLPMAEHLPAWWHPGTAFPVTAIPDLIATWRDQRFQTLIFLKGDSRDTYTYYPRPLLDEMHRDYVIDEHYPSLTIYRRRN